MPWRSNLSSLDKISGVKVKVVLPRHRDFFQSYHRRIRELKDHQENASKRFFLF